MPLQDIRVHISKSNDFLGKSHNISISIVFYVKHRELVSFVVLTAKNSSWETLQHRWGNKNDYFMT